MQGMTTGEHSGSVIFQREKLTLVSSQSYNFSNTSSYPYQAKKLQYQEDFSNYQGLYFSFYGNAVTGGIVTSYTDLLKRFIKINWRQFNTDEQLSSLDISTLTNIQLQAQYKPIYFHWYGYRVSSLEDDRLPLTGQLRYMRQVFYLSPHYFIAVNSQFYNTSWGWSQNTTDHDIFEYPCGFYKFNLLGTNNLFKQNLYGIKIV